MRAELERQKRKRLAATGGGGGSSYAPTGTSSGGGGMGLGAKLGLGLGIPAALLAGGGAYLAHKYSGEGGGVDQFKKDLRGLLGHIPGYEEYLGDTVDNAVDVINPYAQSIYNAGKAGVGTMFNLGKEGVDAIKEGATNLANSGGQVIDNMVQGATEHVGRGIDLMKQGHLLEGGKQALQGVFTGAQEGYNKPVLPPVPTQQAPVGQVQQGAPAGQQAGQQVQQTAPVVQQAQPVQQVQQPAPVPQQKPGLVTTETQATQSTNPPISPGQVPSTATNVTNPVEQSKAYGGRVPRYKLGGPGLLGLLGFKAPLALAGGLGTAIYGGDAIEGVPLLPYKKTIANAIRGVGGLGALGGTLGLIHNISSGLNPSNWVHGKEAGGQVPRYLFGSPYFSGGSLASLGGAAMGAGLGLQLGNPGTARKWLGRGTGILGGAMVGKGLWDLYSRDKQLMEEAPKEAAKEADTEGLITPEELNLDAPVYEVPKTDLTAGLDAPFVQEPLLTADELAAGKKRIKLEPFKKIEDPGIPEHLKFGKTRLDAPLPQGIPLEPHALTDPLANAPKIPQSHAVNTQAYGGYVPRYLFGGYNPSAFILPAVGMGAGYALPEVGGKIFDPGKPGVKGYIGAVGRAATKAGGGILAGKAAAALWNAYTRQRDAIAAREASRKASEKGISATGSPDEGDVLKTIALNPRKNFGPEGPKYANVAIGHNEMGSPKFDIETGEIPAALDMKKTTIPQTLGIELGKKSLSDIPVYDATGEGEPVEKQFGKIGMRMGQLKPFLNLPETDITKQASGGYVPRYAMGVDDKLALAGIGASGLTGLGIGAYELGRMFGGPEIGKDYDKGFSFHPRKRSNLSKYIEGGIGTGGGLLGLFGGAHFLGKYLDAQKRHQARMASDPIYRQVMNARRVQDLSSGDSSDSGSGTGGGQGTIRNPYTYDLDALAAAAQAQRDAQRQQEAAQRQQNLAFPINENTSTTSTQTVNGDPYGSPQEGHLTGGPASIQPINNPYQAQQVAYGGRVPRYGLGGALLGGLGAIGGGIGLGATAMNNKKLSTLGKIGGYLGSGALAAGGLGYGGKNLLDYAMNDSIPAEELTGTGGFHLIPENYDLLPEEYTAPEGYKPIDWFDPKKYLGMERSAARTQAVKDVQEMFPHWTGPKAQVMALREFNQAFPYPYPQLQKKASGGYVPRYALGTGFDPAALGTVGLVGGLAAGNMFNPSKARRIAGNAVALGGLGLGGYGIHKMLTNPHTVAPIREANDTGGAASLGGSINNNPEKVIKVGALPEGGLNAQQQSVLNNDVENAKRELQNMIAQKDYATARQYAQDMSNSLGYDFKPMVEDIEGLAHGGQVPRYAWGDGFDPAALGVMGTVGGLAAGNMFNPGKTRRIIGNAGALGGLGLAGYGIHKMMTDPDIDIPKGVEDPELYKANRQYVKEHPEELKQEGSAASMMKKAQEINAQPEGPLPKNLRPLQIQDRNVPVMDNYRKSIQNFLDVGQVDLAKQMAGIFSQQIGNPNAFDDMFQSEAYGGRVPRYVVGGPRMALGAAGLLGGALAGNLGRPSRLRRIIGDTAAVGGLGLGGWGLGSFLRDRYFTPKPIIAGAGRKVMVNDNGLGYTELEGPKHGDAYFEGETDDMLKKELAPAAYGGRFPRYAVGGRMPGEYVPQYGEGGWLKKGWDWLSGAGEEAKKRQQQRLSPMGGGSFTSNALQANPQQQAPQQQAPQQSGVTGTVAAGQTTPPPTQQQQAPQQQAPQQNTDNWGTYVPKIAKSLFLEGAPGSALVGSAFEGIGQTLQGISGGQTSPYANIAGNIAKGVSSFALPAIGRALFPDSPDRGAFATAANKALTLNPFFGLAGVNPFVNATTQGARMLANKYYNYQKNQAKQAQAAPAAPVAPAAPQAQEQPQQQQSADATVQQPTQQGPQQNTQQSQAAAPQPGFWGNMLNNAASFNNAVSPYLGIAKAFLPGFVGQGLDYASKGISMGKAAYDTSQGLYKTNPQAYQKSLEQGVNAATSFAPSWNTVKNVGSSIGSGLSSFGGALKNAGSAFMGSFGGGNNAQPEVQQQPTAAYGGYIPRHAFGTDGSWGDFLKPARGPLLMGLGALGVKGFKNRTVNTLGLATGLGGFGLGAYDVVRLALQKAKKDALESMGNDPTLITNSIGEYLNKN